MVIFWITSSLFSKIAKSVQSSETAENIWIQLNKRYGTVNETKVFELKKQIASTTQGCLDIASYFNKMKRLWDELGFMYTRNVKKCICTARTTLLLEKEENGLYQFLMGLNDTYVSIRGNLLMMNLLPSLDSAYRILLQDERQRQVTSHSQFSRMTQEQYNQLLIMLQNTRLSITQPCFLASANFADFGATQHMTYNKNLLFDIKPLLIFYLVNLPNGYKVKRPVEVGSLVDGLYKLQTSCTSDVSISTCISSGSACDSLSSISIPAFVFANSDCSHVSPLHNTSLAHILLPTYPIKVELRRADTTASNLVYTR
ncbi:hypothetical protein MTR67_035092 [Solanum verrucosum]|uniref:Retrotransposon gag domain-containing protein n=1 Tax=Solanum verrucosum TaxID=315347 RepID=A0AAF0U9A4_SOLVR|nr:hypothetical protein MTR67_035092 [Solanum verrucosum]